MILGYFIHFHESALCYTDVHVYRATSLCTRVSAVNFPKKDENLLNKQEIFK